MRIFDSKRALRLLAPLAFVLVVGGTGLVAATASADKKLPTRTPEELLVDIQQAKTDGLSGTVVERADLGIPAIPGANGQDDPELTSLVSGTHTLRVRYSSPDKARLAILGTYSEYDIIRNGKDVWTWASKDNAATHRTLTADQAAQPGATPSGTPRTPEEAAQQVLKTLEPTTTVTTDSAVEVAGRPAYELVLTPRDAATLVGQVRIAIDATEHIPLRLQVIPRGGADPAFEVAFTRVSFARPDDAEFRFTPPPGVTVKEGGNDVAAPGKALANPQSTLNRLHEAIGKATGGAAPSGEQGPQVVGSGWTAVLVARNDTPLGHAQPGQQEQPAQPGQPGESGAGPGQGGNPLDRVLGALPRVSGGWGSGRLLRSSLFTVLITDDGRVLVGAVTADRLYQVAATAQAR